MKKLLYAAMIGVMLLAILTACGQNAEKETGVQQKDKTTISEQKNENSEEEKSIKTVKLYFGNDNADGLVAEQREVELKTDYSLERAVMEELIRGPENKELSITMPEGTKVLSAATKDGICTVDLSKEFFDNHPGGSAGEIMTLDSIVNSLTELEGIDKVQLLIEGAKRETFIHLEIGGPMERDESMIQK